MQQCVVKLHQPGSFADPLTEVLRNGARALLAQAIEAEVAEFLAKHLDLKTATGVRRVVRHGHLPEREVLTGIGPVGVRQPRVRDRGAGNDAQRIRFTPAILPPYARRSRSLEVLIPILYLKGISTGDFEEALSALRPLIVYGKGIPSRNNAAAGWADQAHRIGGGNDALASWIKRGCVPLGRGSTRIISMRDTVCSGFSLLPASAVGSTLPSSVRNAAGCSRAIFARYC